MFHFKALVFHSFNLLPVSELKAAIRCFFFFPHVFMCGRSAGYCGNSCYKDVSSFFPSLLGATEFPAVGSKVTASETCNMTENCLMFSYMLIIESQCIFTWCCIPNQHLKCVWDASLSTTAHCTGSQSALLQGGGYISLIYTLKNQFCYVFGTRVLLEHLSVSRF